MTRSSDGSFWPKSYCPPVGDKIWKDIHDDYMKNIVPFITDIHIDFYFRYDMWLHDPKSRLPKENAENFAELIKIFH